MAKVKGFMVCEFGFRRMLFLWYALMSEKDWKL